MNQFIVTVVVGWPRFLSQLFAVGRNRISQTSKGFIVFITTLLLGLYVSTADGAPVWLDFISGTGPDWVTRLNEATSNAEVSNFSEAEQSTIESNILDSLETVYADFMVDFHLTDPGGNRERIHMGASTSSSSTYGTAPVNFRNTSTGTQKIYTANFDNFLESFEPRSKQITEISGVLAGTVAHELGHSLGMRHHAAYGTVGITPANYGDTDGLQNVHVMATGKTGINELERETQRIFSRWSQLTMEAASGIPLVANPLPSTSEDEVDAGDTPASAQALTLSEMPISGFNAALIVGARLDEPATPTGGDDVDIYSFAGFAGDLLSAELWSDNKYVDDFDGQLTLIGPDSLTTIYSNDDVHYSGDKFNSGSKQTDDAFLLNIPLTQTGTHYLKVETVGADPKNLDGDADGKYDLLVGVKTMVPEPDAPLLALLGLIGSIVFFRCGTRG